MATFTRNAWATGDVITADGLNGGKGVNIIEIVPDDFQNGNVNFEIDIATGLSSIDFLNTIVSRPDGSGVKTSLVNLVESYEGNGFLYIQNNDLDMFYYPETGVLTTSIPGGQG